MSVVGCEADCVVSGVYLNVSVVGCEADCAVSGVYLNVCCRM